MQDKNNIHKKLANYIKQRRKFEKETKEQGMPHKFLKKVPYEHDIIFPGKTLRSKILHNDLDEYIKRHKEKIEDPKRKQMWKDDIERYG